MLLWAHGLDLLFSPVCPLYMCIGACLDQVASISQKLRVSERGLGKVQGRLRFADSRLTAAH